MLSRERTIPVTLLLLKHKNHKETAVVLWQVDTISVCQAAKQRRHERCCVRRDGPHSLRRLCSSGCKQIYFRVDIATFT